MILKRNASIIIVIDFTNKSINAIKQTYALAKSLNAKITLMCVGLEAENTKTNELIEITDTTKNESGLEVDSVYISGNIFKSIIQKAIEIESSLIVVDLNTDVKLQPFYSPAEIYKFLKKAPCPVFTIREIDNRSVCKNILMQIDLSAESREKVGVVIQLAKIFNSSVSIISVFPPNNEKYENDLLPYINQVKKYIKSQGVSCSNKSICSKDLSDSILNYAINNNCDVIVQMNKQNLSLKEMLFGTLTNKIVQNSAIPVLSVNPMKRESISSGIH